jgi:putative salt-induced outer membrane protein YdiY
MKFLAGIALFAAAALSASGDTIVMKNGDHLTGTVVKSDGKQLTLKSDYAGEINVQWAAIKELATDKPLFAIMPDKKTVSGKVTTDGSDLVIAPSNASAVHVSLANVTTLRNEAEQAAYEHSQHPGLLENWAGGADVGFALARGNTQTTNLSIAFNAARTTPNDKLMAYLASIYASSNSAGVSGVTANDIRGGARFDRNIVPKIFGFASGDFEYNETQDLDLRSILSGGLGYHAIKRDSTTLDLLAGGNYTRESYSTGELRNTGGLTLGEAFFHKLGKSTIVNQQIFFYPDLTNTGEYRIAFDMGTTTKISKWLGWQTAVSDRYLSNPIPGTKSNDIILTTGLNSSFKH